MAVTELTQRPAPIPDVITVTAELNPRVTPNQMRALKAETGKTMAQILGEDADDEDRVQALVWLELRRMGHTASWEQAGDVAVEFVGEQPDPTSGGSSTGSPPSAATGA